MYSAEALPEARLVHILVPVQYEIQPVVKKLREKLVEQRDDGNGAVIAGVCSVAGLM